MSSVLYSSSENTPVNSLSSGRSTPNSVKRRPKQPNILLPSNHGVYQDYVEIRRPESISSCYSESDRSSIISDGSFFDLSEEITEAISPDARLSVSELEETLTEYDVADKELEKNLDCFKLHEHTIKQLCIQRPNSPTSNFLSSIIPSESSPDIISQMHYKLSPLLHKIQKFEEQSKKLNSLQVKLAVVQEEKRQLSAMLEKRRQQVNEINQLSEQEGLHKKKQTLSFSPIYLSVVGFNQKVDKYTNTNDYTIKSSDVGVQKCLEFDGCLKHKETMTNNPAMKDTGTNVSVGVLVKGCQIKAETIDFSCQTDLKLLCINKDTQTNKIIVKDSSFGDEIAEKFYTNSSTQISKVYSNTFTQCNLPEYLDKNIMVGISSNHLVEKGTGDLVADVLLFSSEVQTDKMIKTNQATECKVSMSEKSLSVGCSYAHLKSTSSQCCVDVKNFQCGEGFAVLQFKDASSNVGVTMVDAYTSTRLIETKSTSTWCEIKTNSVCVGDCSIFDMFCDRCSNLEVQSIGIGEYVNKSLCCVNDKMCECVKHATISVGTSDDAVSDIFCDHCKNLKTSSVGIGENKIDDIFCDKCCNLKTVSCGIGECTIDDLLCDHCTNKTFFDVAVSEDSVDSGFCISCLSREVVSIGIGEGNIHDTSCSKCIANEDKFVFDVDILNAVSLQQQQQQAALCHYCGNKVDLNDSNLDESLQAMRDSMHNFASGMKRSTVSRALNLESCDDSFYKSKDDLESPEDDYRAIMSDEEDNLNSR